MIKELILAIIQAATEFLPISSSGHLALASNFISKPNLFFFTVLHLASLIAVLIFTRTELKELLTFNKKYRKMWLYLIIASIPALLFGYFFKQTIEKSFYSLLIIGIAFIFTGTVLYFTKFSKKYDKLNIKNSLIIGLLQVLALFPGVSRSGMTISAGLFSGINREKATKFSFLLFIPLSISAFFSELGKIQFSFSLSISFFVCLIFSLLFLSLLLTIVKKRKLWMFSFYCWIIGLLAIILHFS